MRTTWPEHSHSLACSPVISSGILKRTWTALRTRSGEFAGFDPLAAIPIRCAAPDGGLQTSNAGLSWTSRTRRSDEAIFIRVSWRRGGNGGITKGRGSKSHRDFKGEALGPFPSRNLIAEKTGAPSHGVEQLTRASLQGEHAAAGTQ
jgi:hypothetical protein